MKFALSNQQNFIDWLKNVPWVLARYAFLTALLLILINIIAGEIIFYKYAFASDRQNIPPKDYVKFESAAYEQVLQSFYARQQRFESADKSYNDPFK